MTAAARALPADVDALDPPDYYAVGERVLAAMLGPDWRVRTCEVHDAIRQAPLDSEWVEARIEALRPMSDGPMRVVERDMWYLSNALTQRRDVWRDVWCQMAVRTPRVWLVPMVGLAMCRADGGMRPLDNRRAQSMLAAGVLVWQFAVYDPDPELPDYPFVVRGLTQGTWQHLLSFWEAHADGARVRVPGRSTLYGTHRKRGAPERAECGYFAAWQDFGLVISRQPNADDVEPGYRGPRRLNEHGETECWAFHELRLRIPLSPEQVLELGAQHARRAPHTRMPLPSIQFEDLNALVDECERSYLDDEDPADEPAAVEHEALADQAVVSSASTDRALPVWCAPQTLPSAADNSAAAIVQRIERSLAILAQFTEPTLPPPPAAPARTLTLVVNERGAPLSTRMRRVLERAEASTSDRDRERAPPDDTAPD